MEEEKKSQSKLTNFVNTKIKSKALKKAFLFLLKNPAVLGTIAAIIGIIIVISIVVILISTIFTTIQVPTDMFFDEEITEEDLGTEEIANNMTGDLCKQNFFDGLLPGLQSGCELLNTINKNITTVEKDTQLSLSRGLVIATIWYAYVSLNEADKEQDIDSSEGQTMLDEIVDSMNNGKVNLSVSDLKEISNNMYHKIEYTYKKREVIGINEDGTKKYDCVSHNSEDIGIDYTKYQLFLRYGETAVSDYEKDLEKKLIYNASNCEKPEDVDLKKYEEAADFNKNEPDTFSHNYDYKTGFIAEKYANIDLEKEINSSKGKFYEYPKYIERLIDTIYSHTTDIDSMFGFDFEYGGYSGEGTYGMITTYIAGEKSLPFEGTLASHRISSLFKAKEVGLRTNPHTGIDFPMIIGSPINAYMDGTVIHSGWKGSYGNLVIIDHGNIGANGENIKTYYGHMSVLNVQAGQQIGGGQKIGECGSTGHSTGPHLHFEMRIDGVTVDPLPYLKQIGG